MRKTTLKELPEERREYLRIEDVLDVEVERPDVDAPARTASSLDMSAGGIRLSGNQPVKRGDMVWTRFSVPTPEGDRVIESLCEVRWASEGDAESTNKYLFGVSFYDIEPSDRELLLRHVFSKHYGIERSAGPSVEATDLRGKNYGVESLRGVSLEVAAGESVALLGPAGAGKSTLIRILATSQKPTSGSAKVMGFDLATQKKEARQSIGYMPREDALYDKLTATENLRFFGRAHKLHGRRLADKIAEALAFTNLLEKAGEPVRKLSPGMRRRLSLACAIVHRPKLLLMDEPVDGAGPALREEFHNYLRQLKDIGVSIIMSTREAAEALESDRVVFMIDGRALADDSPENLMKLGFATVKLTVGGESREFRTQDYRTELPEALRGLGAEISRLEKVEICENTLDDIIRDHFLPGGDAE
ncbi:MAG: putative ABC transporter ATP-binding protein YbhF [bacterium ADurb.Bin236]|nr:MAG: putative ABC transporter ATP-binding protein YbhF [bacterium ADurb.Bin236]HOY62023.1 ATP-binding cassette domain-containing protein [bacterium]HPN94850.1 ATP-binding cassette domain-containing protein [bacterium]